MAKTCRSFFQFLKGKMDYQVSVIRIRVCYSDPCLLFGSDLYQKIKMKQDLTNESKGGIPVRKERWQGKKIWQICTLNVVKPDYHDCAKNIVVWLCFFKYFLQNDAVVSSRCVQFIFGDKWVVAYFIQGCSFSLLASPFYQSQVGHSLIRYVSVKKAESYYY